MRDVAILLFVLALWLIAPAVAWLLEHAAIIFNRQELNQRPVLGKPNPSVAENRCPIPCALKQSVGHEAAVKRKPAVKSPSKFDLSRKRFHIAPAERQRWIVKGSESIRSSQRQFYGYPETEGRSSRTRVGEFRRFGTLILAIKRAGGEL